MRERIAVRTSALFVFAISASIQKLFTSFARLQLDRNTRVTHALAFVSIGLAKLVHLGCDLAQLLLIDTGQRQRRLVLLNTSLRRQTLSLRIDFRRKRKLDRV